MSGLQFGPEMVRAIQAGRKTQTRRLTRADQPCRQRAGRSYAVQPGRGKPAACRILVTDVRTGLLGDITYDDARAEGLRTTEDFKRAWIATHDSKWRDRQLGLLDQETGLTEADHDEAMRVRSLARYDRRWAHKAVHVITFTLGTTDRPRFLAAGGTWNPTQARADQGRRERGEHIPTSDPDRGYTTSPALKLPGEPEPLSDADYAEHVEKRRDRNAVQWREVEQANRDRDRELTSFDERLAAAQRLAKLRHIDVSRELWLVRAHLRRNSPDTAVLRRLEAVERRVDREAA